MGLFNVFQQSVPNFARLAALQNEKHQKNEPTRSVLLNKKELVAMNALKQALVAPTVLLLPNSIGHMTLERTHVINKLDMCYCRSKKTRHQDPSIFFAHVEKCRVKDVSNRKEDACPQFGLY